MGKESNEIEESVPPAPDGGWGWVVCASSFVCMLICDGMLFSFGILYLDLLDYFQGSSGKTALIGSLFMGMSMMGGPLASTLVNVYGIRRVTLCGSLCVFLSFAISPLAPSVEILAVTYGFFGGLSLCMVYIPAILVCGFYFDEKRGIANGLAASGSGVGVFLYSPLSNYLQQMYTWKGAVLILAAISLHTLICGAMFRPIRKKKVSQQPVDDNDYEGEKKSLYSQQKLVLLDKQSEFHVSQTSTEIKLHNQDLISKLKKKAENRLGWPENVCQSFPKLSLSHNPSIINLKQEDGYRSIPNLFKTIVSPHGSSHGVSHDQYLKPLEKRDIFYSGSVRRLHERENHYTSVLSQIGRSKCDVLSHVSLAAYDERSPRGKFVDSAYRVLGCEMLTNPVFAMIVFYSILWTTHSTILTITPLYAVQSGVSKSDAVFLLSVSGIANIFGRIISGWISDKTNFSVVYVVSSALFVGGIDCFCMSISHTYTLFVIESAIFGFCMATWTSLRPIVIVELLGIDNLTNSMGLLALFQGVAFCIGPPLAGLILDQTQSFMLPYVLAGFAFTLSGIVCTLLPRFATYWNKRCQSMDNMQCI